jgi:hypothetical protein
MPATPILALPYPAPTDPADVPTDMGELANQIEAVRGANNGLAPLDAGGHVPAANMGPSRIPTIALASFPPTAPTDGDTYWLIVPASYDPMGGQTVRWLVAYNAAAAAWDVEGAPIGGQVQTSENNTATAYGDLATVGPTVTVPRPGVYIVTSGFQASSATGSMVGWMSYAVGATAAVDADAAGGPVGNFAAPGLSVSRRRTKTFAAAGTVLTAKYRQSSAAGTVAFLGRELTVTPKQIT